MKRLALVTFGLLAAIPATARADILWDLVHAAGAGNDLGTSAVLSLRVGAAPAPAKDVCGVTGTLTCGFITASAGGTLRVAGNNYDAGGDNGGLGPTGVYSMSANTEKGLGICAAGACPSFSEIGEITGSLFLNISTVANSGPLNHIWFSSVQAGEGYATFYSTDSGATYNALAGCSGIGPTIGTEVADCAVAVTGITNLRFDRNASGTGSNDYSVQALRFNSIVPEPGTMGLLATGLVALTGAGYIRRRKKS